MSTITIQDVGPVAHLALDLPAGGGLVVFKGRNGAGKSKSLEAMQSLVSGHGSLDVRDGALKGRVSAFGVDMTVGRSTRRIGELEVVSLTGKLDVSTLVDPGIDNPDAADARRIKALVQLSGMAASPALFADLVGGPAELEAAVSPKTLEASDLVVMAGAIKRDLESAARREESQADIAAGHAKANREATEGVDLDGCQDAAELQRALEEAIKEESRARSATQHSADVKGAAAAARERLDSARAGYEGPTIKAAQDKATAAKTDLEYTVSRVAEARKALADAEHQHEMAGLKYSGAVSAVNAATAHAKSIAGWEETVKAAESVQEIPADAVADAGERVTQARQAVERGALIRRAIEQVRQAEASEAKVKSHMKAGQRLRDAAKGTDDVLSEVVGKTGSALRVEAGRLVLDTGRGATYYADLSMGERWKLALDIAIEAVGERGLLTIPQEAFESLDPTNRRLIAEHVRARGVYVLTAEASDGELSAEVFGA